MTRPKTAEEVERMLERVRCRVCPAGYHFRGFVPRSIECVTCDALPHGGPRRHHHTRKHPRRRLRHYVNGRFH